MTGPLGPTVSEGDPPELLAYGADTPPTPASSLRETCADADVLQGAQIIEKAKKREPTSVPPPVLCHRKPATTHRNRARA